MRFLLPSLTIALVLAGAATLSGSAQPVPEHSQTQRLDLSGDPLPAGAIARLGSRRYRLGFLLYAVDFSPNGKRLAAASAGGGVGVFDRATGRLLWQSRNPTHVYWLAFSPDGKTVAAPGGWVGGRNTVRLLDAETGAEYRQLPANSGGSVMRVAFSPDGRLLATGGHDKAVFLLDTATGKEVHKLTGHTDSVYGLAFSPDGRLLASADLKGSIHLWDVATGTPAGQLAVAVDKANSLCGIVFAPDGTLISAAADGVRLWGVRTGKPGRTLLHDAKARTVTITRDGKRIAVGLTDGGILILDAHAGKKIAGWKPYLYSSGAPSLAFAPDGKVLATAGSWFTRIRMWDPETGRELNRCEGHQATVTALQFTPHGDELLSAGRDALVCRWRVATAAEQGHFRVAEAEMSSIAFSPDAALVVSQERVKPKLSVWSARDGRKRRSLNGTPSLNKDRHFRTALAVSPDKHLLATGGVQVPLALQDAATGKEIRRLGNSPHVAAAVFSPDGRLLAVAEARWAAMPVAAVRLYDVATGKELLHFDSGREAYGVAFSPDGRLLAAAEETSNEIAVWDVATGKQIARFHGQEWFYVVAFSPDGRLLAGAGGDKISEVHVWELASGGEARTFRADTDGVLALAFSPDGRTLASGGTGTILLWDVTGQALGRVQPPRTPHEAERFWNDLGGGNCGRAVDAMYALAATPSLTLETLRKHLKPAKPLAPGRQEKLLADLDSPRFRTRQRATAELEAAGSAVEAALRQALKANPSPEARRRLNQVLHSISSGAESLREKRAVQLLASLRTPEARTILKRLAGGLPEARLTKEAIAALKHLPRSGDRK